MARTSSEQRLQGPFTAKDGHEFWLEYEDCAHCGHSTIAVPTTEEPGVGFVCPRCRLIEIGCKPADGPGPVGDLFPSLAQYLPGATPSHAPNCPKSSQFDRRRRGNLRKCPLGQLGDA